MSYARSRPLTVAIPLRYCHHHCSRIMQPKVKLTPRKIGVQGPSIRRKEPAKVPQFSREELSELKRLSAMLPPRAAKEQDPAQLVLNAANYIQQLVATVRARVNKGTLPVEALAVLPSGSTTTRRIAPRKKRRSIEKRH
ncbi:hypothetical protein KIN20_012960 [Parelaphostrongylus tenuis]|uniref:Uncharacterized protein n=1 Tax=Parelaphostrongylus tenuis TaxID=148309 RepID=A0AAD5MXJ6_PARTN|nr:hypothetical protein KIN20_012960 [Parelaphostrongylus tenuis]